MADLERVYSVDVNGNWGWSTEESAGGGGSQTLAQVLVAGGDPDGNPVTGAVVIDAGLGVVYPLVVSKDVNGNGYGIFVQSDLAFYESLQLQVYHDSAENIDTFVVLNENSQVEFSIGPTGAVTISPSAAVSGLTVKAVGGSTVLEVSAGLVTTTGSFILETTVAVDDGISLVRTDDNRSTFYVSPSALEVRGSGTPGGGGHKRVIQAGLQQGSESLLLADTGGTVGFYGTNPIAKQTGVAVSAAGVHAALVSLGLIAA